MLLIYQCHNVSKQYFCVLQANKTLKDSWKFNFFIYLVCHSLKTFKSCKAYGGLKASVSNWAMYSEIKIYMFKKDLSKCILLKGQPTEDHPFND